jgi:hypothetical protein
MYLSCYPRNKYASLAGQLSVTKQSLKRTCMYRYCHATVNVRVDATWIPNSFLDPLTHNS